MIDRSFYVYALLDPRKPGLYRYGKWKFDHELFYIGKGKGRRYLESSSCFSGNTIKSRIVAKIAGIGKMPISIIKKSGLTEREAFDVERNLIARIGKRNRRTGPLCNIADGGEGSSGAKVSEEVIKRRTKTLKKTIRNRSPDIRERIARQMRESRGYSQEEFRARVAHKNPGIVVLDSFGSFRETGLMRIKLLCGCKAQASAKSLFNTTLKRPSCFSCDFRARIKDELPQLKVLSVPTHTRERVRYKCIAGHMFEQEARVQWNRLSGCPHCNISHLKGRSK